MWEDDEPKPDPEFAARAAESIAETQAAFAGLRHPGKARLLAGIKNDDVVEMIDAFGDAHWSEVPRDQLMFHREALGILAPVAFQFYLPAYLIASLQPGYGAGDIRAYTLMSLRPVLEGETGRRRYEQLTSALTAAQREAVRRFLQAVMLDYGPWGRDPVMVEWGIR